MDIEGGKGSGSQPHAFDVVWQSYKFGGRRPPLGGGAAGEKDEEKEADRAEAGSDRGSGGGGGGGNAKQIMMSPSATGISGWAHGH